MDRGECRPEIVGIAADDADSGATLTEETAEFLVVFDGDDALGRDRTRL